MSAYTARLPAVTTPTFSYGQRAVSWMTVREAISPVDDGWEGHDDKSATEMHQLRGHVIAQAAETEHVLGLILRKFKPAVNVRQAGEGLLRGLRPYLEGRFDAELAVIEAAKDRRNRCVHDSVVIGSSWRPFQTGGGEYVPVISLLGTEEIDENDLRNDLLLQQAATEAAVRTGIALGVI